MNLKNADDRALLRRYYDKCDAVTFGTAAVKTYILYYVSSGSHREELNKTLAEVEEALVCLKELHAEVLRRKAAADEPGTEFGNVSTDSRATPPDGRVRS